MAWEPTVKPIIVCAANQLPDGTLLLGARHWDTQMRSQMRERYGKDWHNTTSFGTIPQGFMDQFGRWFSREEAMQIARQNHQIIVAEEEMLSLTALHSEDLY